MYQPCIREQKAASAVTTICSKKAKCCPSKLKSDSRYEPEKKEENKVSVPLLKSEIVFSMAT